MTQLASSTLFSAMIIILSALFLSSCGQKGPLVLPQPTTPPTVEPAAENSQPATTNNAQ